MRHNTISCRIYNLFFARIVLHTNWNLRRTLQNAKWHFKNVFVKHDIILVYDDMNQTSKQQRILNVYYILCQFCYLIFDIKYLNLLHAMHQRRLRSYFSLLLISHITYIDWIWRKSNNTWFINKKRSFMCRYVIINLQ